MPEPLRLLGQTRQNISYRHTHAPTFPQPIGAVNATPHFERTWVWLAGDVERWLSKPGSQLIFEPMCARGWKEPARGLEPLTSRLQVRCATNCATPAEMRLLP